MALKSHEKGGATKTAKRQRFASIQNAEIDASNPAIKLSSAPPKPKPNPPKPNPPPSPQEPPIVPPVPFPKSPSTTRSDFAFLQDNNMEFNDILVDEALQLLKLPERVALQRLGLELVKIGPERKEGYRDLVMIAKQFLEENRVMLADALCPDWGERKKEDVNDTRDILVALAAAVAERVDIPGGTEILVLVLASIILRRGVDWLCAK